MDLSEYMSQVCGFILLVIPPTFLLSLPFLDYEYAFKKRTLYSIIYCADIICVLLIPLMMDNHTITWILRVLILSDSIFSLFFYFRLLKVHPIKKILGATPAILYVYFIFLIRTIISNGSAPILNGGYNWKDALFMLCISLIFVPLNMFIIKKIVQPQLSVLNIDLAKNECTYFIICFFGYCFTLSAYIVLGKNLNESWVYMSPIFLVVMCMICILYYLILKDSMRKNEEAYQKKITETRILEYRKLELEIDKARRQQHDETHYLTNLYILVEQGDLNAVKQYMEHITGKHTLLIKEDFCENHIINNLLQYYISWAKSLHVNYEIHVHVPEYVIDEDDLCVLFGNLLENAILTLQSMNEDQRNLTIHAGVKEEILLISIEHSCSYIYQSDTYQKNKRFQSASSFNNIMFKDTQGLKIIEQIARKYNGSADYCFDKEKQEFISRILLKIEHE